MVLDVEESFLEGVLCFLRRTFRRGCGILCGFLRLSQLLGIVPLDPDVYKRQHYIRRTSDRLCKEHGLSVIIPGQVKGKCYIEHQATQNGTSYKAKLKAVIHRLLPACSNLEELLRRLQREGYEIKRGKYISCLLYTSRTGAGS